MSTQLPSNTAAVSGLELWLSSARQRGGTTTSPATPPASSSIHWTNLSSTERALLAATSESTGRPFETTSSTKVNDSLTEDERIMLAASFEAFSPTGGRSLAGVPLRSSAPPAVAGAGRSWEDRSLAALQAGSPSVHTARLSAPKATWTKLPPQTLRPTALVPERATPSPAFAAKLVDNVPMSPDPSNAPSAPTVSSTKTQAVSDTLPYAEYTKHSVVSTAITRTDSLKSPFSFVEPQEIPTTKSARAKSSSLDAPPNSPSQRTPDLQPTSVSTSDSDVIEMRNSKVVPSLGMAIDVLRDIPSAETRMSPMVHEPSQDELAKGIEADDNANVDEAGQPYCPPNGTFWDGCRWVTIECDTPLERSYRNDSVPPVASKPTFPFVDPSSLQPSTPPHLMRLQLPPLTAPPTPSSSVDGSDNESTHPLATPSRISKPLSLRPTTPVAQIGNGGYSCPKSNGRGYGVESSVEKGFTPRGRSASNAWWTMWPNTYAAAPQIAMNHTLLDPSPMKPVAFTNADAQPTRGSKRKYDQEEAPETESMTSHQGVLARTAKRIRLEAPAFIAGAVAAYAGLAYL